MTRKIFLTAIWGIVLIACDVFSVSPTETVNLTIPAIFTQARGLNPLSTTTTATQPISPTGTAVVIPTITQTLIPSPTLFPEPNGCQRPPDDYTRVLVDGHWLNQRTYAMLLNAAEIYAGVIDVSDTAITQGSYVDSEPLSFGTHAGGGAVDISVIDRTVWEVLYSEFDGLLNALRIAGFAAWVREYGELSAASPVHIHAIAIGDAELSLPAVQQLTGPAGYFRGFNGLPTDDNVPIADRYGAPVICRWMLEIGYSDMSD